MISLKRFGITSSTTTTLHPTSFSSNINEDDIIGMCEDLLRNRTITSVDFSYIPISVKAMEAIGRVISHEYSAATVKYLKLSHCGLNAEALNAFVTGIGVDGCISSLTSIDLSYNNIMDDGAEIIAAYLAKYNSDIIPLVGIADCSPVIHEGHRMTITDTDSPTAMSSTSSALPLSTQLSRIRKSSLYKNSERRSYIHTLELAGCKIGIRGAAAIGCVIGGFTPPHRPVHGKGEGEKSKTGNSRLTVLNLERNKLKCAGVSHICQGLMSNQYLRHLNISTNSISAEGGNVIARMLTSNQSLETLLVWDNYLSESMPVIALALAHRGHSSCLDFSVNRISSDTCVMMSKKLGESRFFVSCLSFDGNTIGDDGLSALFSIIKGTGVELLTLSDIGITGKSAPVLANIVRYCENLSSLHIDGNIIGDEGIVMVLEAISKSSVLEALNLRCCGLGQLSVVALASCLTKLRSRFRYLTLSDNKNVNILPVLDALCRCSAIRDLDLSDMGLGTDASGWGSEFTANVADTSDGDISNQTGGLHMQEDITGSYMRAFVKVFSANPQLDIINLVGNPIADVIKEPMTRKFAKAISDNVTDFDNLRTLGTLGTLCTRNFISPAAVFANRDAHRRMVSSLFHPKWAENSNIIERSYTSDDDSGGEDGHDIPLVPHADSLHHPLYPGFGNGRFSNSCHISSMSDPYPYTIVNSVGVEPPTVMYSDSAAVFMHPIRRPLKRSPYINAIENNISKVPITEHSLRSIFQALDTDDSGSLDKREFMKMYLGFEFFGVSPTETEVEDLLNRYNIDENNDNRVSFDQFCMLMLKLAQL